MAVETTSRKTKQAMTILLTEYDFTFRALIASPEDIKCIRTITATNTDEDMEYVADIPAPSEATDVLKYAVDINDDGVGGTVMVAWPSTGCTITIYRETTDIQSSDYDDYNQFPADTVENDFDKRTMITQEMQEEIDRSLKYAITAPTGSTLPAGEANLFIGWDADGILLENKSLPDPSILEAASQADAMLGTDNTDYMTPLRTRQALSYLDVRNYGAAIDGITDDTSAIQDAIDACDTAGGGIVFMPAGTYSTISSVYSKNGVHLVGGSRYEGSIIQYSGSGSAIVVDDVSGGRVVDIKIQCTHDSAHGIEISGNTRQLTLSRLDINNDDAAGSAAGAGIYFNPGGDWIGGVMLDSVKSTSFKHGIYFNGSSTTAVVGIDVWLVGRGAGIIAGSAGIYCTNDFGGVGSYFLGGTIESFATGVQIASGGTGALKLSVACNFENNTANYSLPANWNGRIESQNGGGWFIEQNTNAASNVWYKDYHLSGQYIKESYYDQKHVIYDAGGNRTFGFYRGDSLVSGGTPIAKWGFYSNSSAGASPSATAGDNYMFILDRKLTLATAAPTTGTWKIGDLVFNSAAAAGGKVGWVCTTAGTPGTWKAFGVIDS